MHKLRSGHFYVNRVWCLLAFAAISLIASGCATQPAQNHDHAGFFLGLFHGFFALVTLLLSFFYNMRIYEYPNSGIWYDVGFALGFAMSNILLFLSIIARIGGYIVSGRL